MLSRNAVSQMIKTLSPGYFSMVMATGIVAIAAQMLNFPRISLVLGYFNGLIFFILLLLSLTRLILHFSYVKKDFYDFKKSPGFFTIVAASAVLGYQSFTIFQNEMLAIIFLIFSFIAWGVINYSFFHIITTREVKPSIANGIDGSWLLVIVAIQSLSALTSRVSTIVDHPELLIFISICLFLTGCTLYLIFITLIVYRLTFFKINAYDFEASYWINMGATAISTLAGSTLILQLHKLDSFLDLVPFLKGFSLLNWAVASWWIPLLILFGIWKHIIKKIPPPFLHSGYSANYWGMVFPLGMYTVATIQLSRLSELHFIHAISEYFVYLAFTAWTVVFVGFIASSTVRIKKGG